MTLPAGDSRGPWRALLGPGLPRAEQVTSEGIAAQAALSTAGMLVQGLARFLLSVVIGNVFGEAVLGSVNAGISAALFASLLVPTASANAVTKYAALLRGAGRPGGADRVVRALAAGTGLVSVLLGVATALAVWLMTDLDLVGCVLAGAVAVTYSGYVFLRGALFGLGRVARAAVWDLASALMVGVVLVAVVLTERPSWLLAPLVVGYATYVLPNLPGRGPGGLPRDVRSELGRFFHQSLVQTVSTAGFLQLSMVAAHGWDRAGSGAFAAALALATPASLLARSLQLTLFPRMASSRGSGDLAGLRRQTDLSTRLLLVFSLGIYGSLILASQLVMRIFFPAIQGPGPSVLAILLAAVMVQNSVVGVTNDLMAGDAAAARVVTTWAVAGAAGGLLGWCLLGPWLGAPGVAWGYLLGTVIMAGPPLMHVWRMHALSWWSPVGRYAGGAAVAALGAWWLQGTQAPLWWGLLAASLFLLAWTALSWRDVREVWSRRR